MSLIQDIAKIQKRYSQSPQRNPIEWCFLYKEEDGSYIPQTGMFQCRDFFNDIVAKKKDNFPIDIYGFSNRDLKFNEDAAYIFVKNLQDKDLFQKNIQHALNPMLLKTFGKQIEFENYQGKSLILKLPNELLDTTYTISLATFFIRCSNYTYEFTCWEDFFKPEAPCVALEGLNTGYFVPLSSVKKYEFTPGLDSWHNAPVKDSGYIHANGFRDVLYRKEMTK